MIRALTLLALPVLAAPLAAETAQCTFTTECFEAEACADSAFSLTADLTGQTLETEFGTFPARLLERAEGALTALATGGGATYLLTSTADGARLSVHMQGPMLVTYHGTCSEAD